MNAEIGKYWRGQKALFEKIHSYGIKEYAENLGIEKAFASQNGVVTCMDEGTPQGDFRLAGSGILLGEEDARRLLEPYVEKGIVKEITSHDECGAAKIYAVQNGFDPSEGDKLGKEFSRTIADKLGVNYRHIPIEEMARPSGFHIARVVYVDGTGMFNPSRIEQLPIGFVVSRRFLQKDYALQEVETAIKIALGDHGFGERLTKDSPFFVVPIGDPKNTNFSLDTLVKEVEPLARKYEGRVVVDGFEVIF